MKEVLTTEKPGYLVAKGDQDCAHCYFSLVRSTGDLACHRHAPVPKTSTSDCAWPLVEEEDWCGEFKRADGSNEWKCPFCDAPLKTTEDKRWAHAIPRGPLIEKADYPDGCPYKDDWLSMVEMERITVALIDAEME